VTPRLVPEHLDVIVIGAGLSGIGVAYHLQTRCAGKRYAILEARDTLGGTWDVFRYPGIRSDSDMYTLGYPFRPWPNREAIADGAAILAYLRDTARAFGIDDKIRYRHRVQRAAWSSRDARWTLTIHDGATGATIQLTCGFLVLCAGYYDHDAGYTPELPGRERFRGRIVHPQRWTPDIDHANRRVVVIGSGATAVTLVPALARTAAHVTMLQRSPSYVVALPARDRAVGWVRRVSPRAAHAVGRWKYLVLGQGFYAFCRRYPEQAARLMIGRVRRAVRGAVDVAPHFTPSYQPWDQRLLVAPDGDLFRAIRAGTVSIVTDHVASIDETGVCLRSGRHLDADLIVTATGLQLRVLGAVEATVDGARIDPSALVVYRGVMCSGVPNLAFVTGYTNASWTLKADLTAQYVCRLLAHMDRHGYARCCPRAPAAGTAQAPMFDLAAGYVRRSIDTLPRQGSENPWRMHQSYARDLWTIKYGRVTDRALAFE
jgi:monooxygenase